MRSRDLAMLVLLALCCADAMAAWSNAGRTPEAVVYIDRAITRSPNGAIRMWDLFDFGAAQEVDGVHYLSLQSLAEYDCARARTRPLRILAFSRNMGNGVITSALDSAGPWEQVRPATMEEALWRRACSKPAPRPHAA